MNTIQRIAKNTGVLLISQIASHIIGFFFIMYTARYLGADGFGTLSFALAFTGIFGVFADLGLQPLIAREVARDKILAGKYLGNVSVIKTILAAFTFGIIALTVNLVGYPEQTIEVVYLVALSVIFSAFSQMFYAIFQAFEKMEYQSIGQILNFSLLLSGALFAISHGFSVIGFASLFFLASAIVLLYCIVVCLRKFSKPKMEVDLSFWRVTIKEALPFGLSGIFIMIYYYIDTVMLSLMIPDANDVLGWYNAAYRLVLVLLVIPSVYFASIFPIMSRLYKTSKESLKFVHEHSFKYMVMIAFPIGMGTTLLADKIILLIFGSDFAPATIALQILVWSSVLIFMSQAFGKLVNSTNRQIVETKITATGAILNVILNLLLIPKFSYVAASVTTVATEFFVLLAYLFVFSKTKYKLRGRFVLGITSKVFFSCLVTAAFIEYFKDINLLALMTISALIYGGVLYLVRGFDESDIHMFKNLTRINIHEGG